MGSDTINSAKRFTERRFMMAAHSDKDICTTKPNKGTIKLNAEIMILIQRKIY